MQENGFDWYQEDAASRSSLLKSLLESAAAEFDYEPVEEKDPGGDDRLTKYWYKKSSGMSSSSGTRTTSSWIKNAKPNNKALKMVKDMSIKVENPGLVTLKSRAKVLADGKRVLEKKLSEVKDQQARIENAYTNKDEGKKKCDAAVKTLETFLQAVRSKLVHASTFASDSDEGDIKKCTEELNKTITEADNHKDAATEMLKFLKANVL